MSLTDLKAEGTGAAAKYIQRHVDTEVSQSLQNGEWCYVFGPRQVGKSSLLAKLKSAFAKLAGYRCAGLSLFSIDSAREGANLFYRDFAHRLAAQLELRSNWESDWPLADSSPLARWTDFLTKFVPQTCHERIIILIDDIDELIFRPFAEEFLGMIRALSDSRKEQPELARFTFCFSGSYPPNNFMEDNEHSPFEIAQHFWIDDFSIKEMQQLIIGSAINHPKEIFQECYRWTKGHPDLTKKVLRDLLAKGRFHAARIPHEVKNTIDNLFLNSAQTGDEVMENASRRCLRDGPDATAFEKVSLYKKLLTEWPLIADQNSEVELALRLAGLAVYRAEEDTTRLYPRNDIMSARYNVAWAEAQLSQIEKQDQQSRSISIPDPKLAEITQKVDRFFCKKKLYEKSGQGVALLPGILYRFTLTNKNADKQILQLYNGITGIGGELWENEMRAINSAAARHHPALPEMREGDFDKHEDIAYILTDAAQRTLDEPGFMEKLRQDDQDNRSEALRHLLSLAEGLELLHLNGLVHRNLHPESIEVYTKDGKQQLRLSRFEMSSLLANLLRELDPQESRVDSDRPENLADQARQFYRRQKPSALACASPERLAFIYGEKGQDMYESARSDVFGLGMIAYQLFVGPLPKEQTARAFPPDREEPQKHNYFRQEYFNLIEEINGMVNAAALPKQLQDLIHKCLEWDWRIRYTATEAKNKLIKEYEDISGYWSEDEQQSYLLAYHPEEAAKFIGEHGLLTYPRNTREGREELIEFLEADLLQAELAYSDSGFGDGTNKQKNARYVLLGRKMAYFCSLYGETDEGPEVPEVLMYRFCKERDLAWRIDLFSTIKRRAPLLKIVSRYSDAVQPDNAKKYPSWQNLLDSVEGQKTKGWSSTVYEAFKWFFELSQVRWEARLYPVTIKTPDAGREFQVTFDEERDRQWRVEGNNLRFLYTKTPDRRPSLRDFFATEAERGSEVYLRADREGKPDLKRDNLITGKFIRVAENVQQIVIEFEASSGPIPSIGWLHLAEDEGMRQQIKRQTDAMKKLMEMPGLVAQLKDPRTPDRLPFHWSKAGECLQGNSPQVVRNMLKSLPFYALQGPPGTGKTTIAAEAVVETLGRDRNLHVLISAQSHHALDNLAERIISDERLIPSLGKELSAAQKDEDEKNKEKFVYIRIASDPSKKRVSPQMQQYFAATVTADCITRIEKADAKIKEKGDTESYQYNDKLKDIRARWKKEAKKSHFQLQSLLTRGANLIFCTTGAAIDDHLGASSNDIFDWVIVEEAAKAWPTELIMPLIYGQRWTLIGDHKQLPPFGRDEVENILDACAKSSRDYEDLRKHGERKTAYLSVFNLFENMFNPENKDKNKFRPVEELTYQFRMAKPIADLVSQVFYDKDWDTTENLKDIKPPLRGPDWLVKDNLIWLDTRDVKNAHEEPQWQNHGEAEIVKNLTDVILKNLIKTKKKDSQEKTLLEQLAILSPYTAQRELLEGWLSPKLKSCLNTVDSFQGSEAEIVIISLVRNNNDKTKPRDRLGFLLDQKRVNVLLSRACSLLILVGNYRHFAETDVDWWKKICKIFNRRDRVINVLKCNLVTNKENIR